MLIVARNTIVSHSKGQQKQYERRVNFSASSEMISEKKEVNNKVSFEVDIKNVQ